MRHWKPYILHATKRGARVILLRSRKPCTRMRSPTYFVRPSAARGWRSYDNDNNNNNNDNTYMKSPSCTVYVGLAQARPNYYACSCTLTSEPHACILYPLVTPYQWTSCSSCSLVSLSNTLPVNLMQLMQSWLPTPTYPPPPRPLPNWPQQSSALFTIPNRFPWQVLVSESNLPKQNCCAPTRIAPQLLSSNSKHVTFPLANIPGFLITWATCTWKSAKDH